MAVEYRTEPEYIEYLDGKAYPKVSPRHAHAVVQARLALIVSRCAGDRGAVGTELDALVGKVDGTRSKLIPDLSFVSRERIRIMYEQHQSAPPFAPDIAIEVRSPGDRPAYLTRKIARYLATGSILVLDVQPKTRTIVAHDTDRVLTSGPGETFAIDTVPWLTFPVDEVFSVLDFP